MMVKRTAFIDDIWERLEGLEWERLELIEDHATVGHTSFEPACDTCFLEAVAKGQP